MTHDDWLLLWRAGEPLFLWCSFVAGVLWLLYWRGL